MENEVVQLYLDDIIPNRFQPREVFDDQALKELAISIREHGVIQPILVRKFGEKYEIIAGERRYKASTMAGLTKIPAIVKNLDDKESSKVALIENLQRRDLTPIEEARTYQKILDLDEMTQEQLAKTMGKSQSAVSNKLRLLSLPDEIQEALLKEEISERHARSLLNIEDKNIQIELLKEIVANKMPVRELDLRIKKLNGGGDNTSNPDESGGNSNNLSIDNSADNVNTDNIFSKPDVVNITNPTENLFESNDSNVNDMKTPDLFSNNSSNDSNNNVIESIDNDLSSKNTGVDNMNNDSLFGSNSTLNGSNGFFQNSATNVNDSNNNNNNNNNNNLFNDPTTVDINKIREQSSDINFGNTNEKKDFDVKNLVRPEGFSEDASNRFIPDFEDKTIEKTEDGNEVIGNGLLAGMPVIKPVDSNIPNNSESQNNFNNLTQNATSNTSDMNNSLFGSNQDNNTQNNSLDSLFGATTNVVPNDNNPVEQTTNNSLFGSSDNQNAVNNSEVISSNNVQVAVEDVKNVIKSYQDKGYVVSVEELNLDREIQLIIKFNKN